MSQAVGVLVAASSPTKLTTGDLGVPIGTFYFRGISVRGGFGGISFFAVCNIGPVT